jgi:Fe-S cluster biogenesis protein NfuA/nitrite reductase/ring-hydroxylating ferredoxin subunit
MAQPEGPGPDESNDFDSGRHWRSAGDRIQNLLDAMAVSGPAARERAESLVGELTDLYGAGMHRMMTIAAATDPSLIEQFATDDLLASLMLVHGFHPHGVQRRIADALDSVRPYLGSHGGDVTLRDVVDGRDGLVIRLAFAGSCKSCPSSAVTLELTVEDAVRAAAPEVVSIEVVAAEADSTPGLISADSLLSRVHTRDSPGTAWHAVPDIAILEPGEVGGFMVAGVTVLACRVGDDVYAYLDRCGSCGQSLAGAVLHRRMGAGDAVLRCPQCHAHFDAVHAGAGLDDAAGSDVHLDPLPLLVRDGVLSLAVLAETTGVG